MENILGIGKEMRKHNWFNIDNFTYSCIVDE